MGCFFSWGSLFQISNWSWLFGILFPEDLPVIFHVFEDYNGKYLHAFPKCNSSTLKRPWTKKSRRTDMLSFKMRAFVLRTRPPVPAIMLNSDHRIMITCLVLQFFCKGFNMWRGSHLWQKLGWWEHGGGLSLLCHPDRGIFSPKEACLAPHSLFCQNLKWDLYILWLEHVFKGFF